MYNIFRQVIPRINEERIFVANYNGNFYIELIIVKGFTKKRKSFKLSLHSLIH